MSDRATELETAISEIYGEMQSLQTKVDRLCALARQPECKDQDIQVPVSSSEDERYEIAAFAFRRHGFRFNDLKVQRVCREHAGQGDFAIKLGVWNVRLPLFDIFAERVKRGIERF